MHRKEDLVDSSAQIAPNVCSGVFVYVFLGKT